MPAPGPSLPAEADDEDAGGVGVEEGQLDRVGERVGAAGDREVDDVDAVEDGLGDRGGRVGGEAALDAADLVDRDPGAGRDAVDRAAVDAEDRCRGDGRRRPTVVAVWVPWPLLSRAVVERLVAARSGSR